MAINHRALALSKSLVLHAVVLSGASLLPAGPLRRSAQPDEVEVVFHSPPPPVEIPPPTVPPLARGGSIPAGPPAGRAALPAHPVVPPAPGEPVAMDTPGVPEGPEDVPVAETPQEKVGKSGLLAFRDQIASVAEDKTVQRLGVGARLSAAADASPSSSGGILLHAVGNGSGGIDAAALTRNLGGGGGDGGAGGGGRGMQGVPVGRATDSLAGIGKGGGPRALTGGGPGAGAPGHGGPGPARTDEEIQIVFDRHKASFYRLYHRELRNDPTLKGQIVLRLTIDPDGRVSMCMLQSTDMHAPDLAAQVVEKVRGINFGAKDGVQALTIVYPIDFLPAA